MNFVCRIGFVLRFFSMELDLDFGVAHVTFHALKLGKYAGCIGFPWFLFSMYILHRFMNLKLIPPTTHT